MNVMILAAAAALNIPGPGGLSVSIDTVGPAPTYSVIVDSDTLVSPSPLGLVTDYADLATNLRAAGPVQIKDTVIDYTLDRIKKKTVNKRAVKATIPFVNPQGWRMGIEFVLTDNDMAFRYTLPHQKDRGSVRVMREATGFAFPQQTTLFLTPQSDAMIGWKRTKPSYEEYYITDAPIDTKSQYGHGFTFPGLFRVGDKGWVLVTETGVNRDYCGSRLSDSDNGLFRLEFPMAEENNGNGTVEPAFALPGATPWRTVTAAKTLKPIVETTIPWDVVSPIYGASRQYAPARGTWSWILWQDDSINDRDLREYVRLAKEMGFEYTLVDNWWDKNLGRKGMEELIKYSRTQGVEPILWYSSSGYWNDIVQGPVNRMENPRIRRQEMQWLKDNGVKAVKVDFFGGDKQETMRLYEAILTDANDFGIMVIFHGCTMPRGWERMFPNYIGSEAVLASENMIFSQEFCDREAVSSSLHPFIRNAAGSMEYGGTFLNKRMHRSDDKGNERRTSDAFQIATAVLFQSPQQNFALSPDNLTEENKTALDFMRGVPTRWDDTEFFEGYPGKYVVLTRTAGDKTYTAGINAEDEARTVTFDKFNPAMKYTLITDSHAKKGDRLKSQEIKGKKAVKIKLAKGEGFVLTGTK